MTTQGCEVQYSLRTRKVRRIVAPVRLACLVFLATLAHRHRTRECWSALRPFLIEGSYSNYVSDEGDTFARAAYGPNYDRLVALKNKYDPANFFRMNHNIKPTA